MQRVYVILNTENSKHYVGQTKKTARVRFSEHVNNAKQENPKTVIAKAIKKYGADSFTLLEAHECESERANELEAQLIIKFNSLVPDGYNVLKFGQVSDMPDGWWKGKKRDAETVSKIRTAKIDFYANNPNPLKGRKLSSERTLKLKERSLDWWKGLSETERVAHNKKCGAWKLGHTVSSETRAKISKANTGKVRSEEARQKIGNSKRGLTQSKETIEKRAAKLRGKKHTVESKANFLQAQINRVPAETKEKLIKCKQMIIDGYSNKEIAESLDMTYEHVRKIRKDKGGRSVPWPQPYTPNKAWERLKDKLS